MKQYKAYETYRKDAVLITGASDRIGKHIAFAFADMGYDILLHYFSSEEKAVKVRDEIIKMGAGCSLFRADFKNPAEVSALLHKAAKTANLKCLVNNASIFVKSSLSDTGQNRFDEIFNINFRAAYILTKELARIVKNGGLIINMLDSQIVRNNTKYFDYLLTKKLLCDFTKMSAVHLAPRIRVNGIAPGLILPPHGKDIDYLERLAEKIPMKKKGTVMHITETVRYLVNNEFVTGQVIFVDGGACL